MVLIKSVRICESLLILYARYWIMRLRNLDFGLRVSGSKDMGCAMWDVIFKTKDAGFGDCGISKKNDNKDTPLDTGYFQLNCAIL